MGKVKVGSAWPLGSSVTLDGVNFSIAAPHATNLELLIFQNEDDEYAKIGVEIKASSKEVLNSSKTIIKVNCPSTNLNVIIASEIPR